MKRPATNDWKRVRAIFDDALRRPAQDRPDFLRRSCGDDEDMRLEVESLLESLDSAELFLETPAVIQVAENTIGTENRLSTGEMLLHYEVGDLLGSGGMGEVYLARDTRLNRNVAIKVLRASFLPDEHANRRLFREARAAALLEHPNICQIYEISETSDHTFIVMQYVVGTTLGDMLAAKQLTISTALDLATQIADGLAEAHSQGIIHRDIKPANIIVNGKGQVKILDFGLAKFIEAESSSETSQRLNSTGAVMGTVPFMSPEQLRGKAVDKRTDIFSLGALLYEMLAGKPAFNRDNNAETISSILNDEPDWALLPAELRTIVRKCLAKDVDARYASAAALLDDLRKIETTGGFGDRIPAGETSPGGKVVTDDSKAAKKRQFYFWQSADAVSMERTAASLTPELEPKAKSLKWIVMSSLVIVLVIGGAAVWIWEKVKLDTVNNFEALQSVKLVSWKSGAATSLTDFRISHDGETVAYTSSQLGGSEAIYIKQIAGGDELQVTKDEWTNVGPLWSPDDQRIAYVSVRENKPGIYMVAKLGGVVTPLAITDKANISLRHWARDDDAIFYEQNGNLYRLDLGTRDITKVTGLPETPNNTRYFGVSPDEKTLVYCDVRDGQKDVWVSTVNGGEAIRITNDADAELRPRWHPDGDRILYNVFRNELAQINVATADGKTPPIPVTRGDRSYLLIDVSPQGDKVYYTSSEIRSDITSVTVDSGRETGVASEPDLEYWSAASPDGRSIVYQLSLSNQKMYDSAFILRSNDGKQMQLAGKGFDAQWLPDGRRLMVFRINKTDDSVYEAWVIDTVTGEERRITNENVMTQAWSPMPILRTDITVLDFAPDGSRFVYLDSRVPQNVKVGLVDSDGVTSLTRNENRALRYFSPKFSPEGSRIAIVSLEESADKAQKPVRRLHVFDGDAGREVYRTTDITRLVGWSTDSDLILGTINKGIPGFPLAVDIVTVSVKGASRKLFTLDRAYLRTLTISPDGKALAFVAQNDGRDDIWTVSLTDGAEPKQITFSGNSRVYLANLVFSPDGKTIYFDKQEEINTISMYENFN